MARGRHGSPAPNPLPKPHFERVQDEVSEYQAGVNSNQMKSFGYNDVQLDFRRPDHYIRHIEPLESDLATTVEYDMDEQDQEWLELVNADRKKEQLDLVSYEMFEIIMDRLEKEWFNLTKNLPKPDLAMPSEDSTCAVCDDSEGENNCYGVPYIPEGQWLCRKCTVSPETPVACLLCPNEGGAFKQTVHGEWLHLLCAIWIPETRVVNDVFMEPIMGVERISKQRWKLRCSVCDVRKGACIQCAKPSCFVAFHATCARKEKLLMPMKAAQGAEPVTLTCYCEKHLPPEQQEIRAAALGSSLDTDEDNNADEEQEEQEEEQEEDEDNVSISEQRHSRASRHQRHRRGSTPAYASHPYHNTTPRTRTRTQTNHHHPPPTPTSHHTNPPTKSSSQLTPKSARAYAKTYKTSSPPLVPIVVVNRIVQYISKVSMRKRVEFVMMMCRYWSLKREARRGAPLLKRLHLEPWTTGVKGARTEEEMGAQLELLQSVRRNLVRVRDMIELCRKRETRKLRQHEIVQRLLTDALFPHLGALRVLFEKILNMDRSEYFKHPVSRQEVPDYFAVVTHPMSWTQIEEKLEKNMYWDFDHFQHDVDLVLSNALLYNKVGSNIHKAANRIYGATRPLFVELKKLKNTHAGNPGPYLPLGKVNGVAAGKGGKEGKEVDEDGDEDAEGEEDAEGGEDGEPMDTREDDPNSTSTSTSNPNPNPEPTQPTFAFSSPPTNPHYISDFEPTLQTLDLLLAPQTISEDLNMEVDEPPIVSLLKYQFAKMKPMPLDTGGGSGVDGSPSSATKGFAGPGPGLGEGGVDAAGIKSGGGGPGGGGGAKGRKPRKRDRKAEAERAKARKAEAAARAAAAAAATQGECNTDQDIDLPHEQDDDHDHAVTVQRKKARDIQAALDSSAGFRAPNLKIMTNNTTMVIPGGGGSVGSGGSATTISATGSTTGSEVGSGGGPPPPIPVPISIPGSIVVNGNGTASGNGTGKKRGSLTSSSSVVGHGLGLGLAGFGGVGLGVGGIGDLNVPKVVNDVDNRGSFQLFNQGWILPADQKRGGRSSGGGGFSGMTSTPSSVEPPRKKLKIDPGSSSRKVSLASTTPSEVHTPLLPAFSANSHPPRSYSQSRPQSAVDDPDHRQHPEFESPLPEDRMKVDSISPVIPTHTPVSPFQAHSQSLPLYPERQRRLSKATRAFNPVSPIGTSSSLPPSTSPIVMMHPEGEDGIDAPHNVVTQPNGVVIIEKLDTPAIRRERNMRRKAEKKKNQMMMMDVGEDRPGDSASGGGNNGPISAGLESVGSSTSDQNLKSKLPFSTGGSDEDPSGIRMVGVDSSKKGDIHGPSRAMGKTDGDEGDDEKEDEDADADADADADGEPDDGQEEESTLSEITGSGPMDDEDGNDLMQGGDENDEDRAPSSPGRGGYSRTRSRSGRGPNISGRKSSRTEVFMDGTLVWAKAESYPWWPAVVFKDDNPLVPRNILSAYFEKRQKKKIKLYIVQFYDKQKSWQTVAREKLVLLGEDVKFDDEMLSENNSKQKWKSKQSRDLCISAYRAAMADMDPSSSNNPAALAVAHQSHTATATSATEQVIEET